MFDEIQSQPWLIDHTTEPEVCETVAQLSLGWPVEGKHADDGL
jgi:hypothetical protein